MRIEDGTDADGLRLIYATAVMASLDDLPGDQRAVLQLVLGRGRSYAEIARLLSINPDAVRERALAALDVLGPATRAPEENRMAICDYLLGQLPEEQAPHVRELLAGSAAERAWAQAVSADLAPIAPSALPEIPQARSGEPAPPPSVPSPAPTPSSAPAATVAPQGGDPVTGDAAGGTQGSGRRSLLRRRGRRAPDDAPPPPPPPPDDDNDSDGDGRPSSRRGGMVVIGIGVIVIIVVLVLVFKHNGPSGSTTSSTAAAAPPSLTSSTTAPAATTPAATTAPVATTPAATTPATGTTSAAAGSTTATTSGAAGTSNLRQINLNPPAGGPEPAAVGIADIIPQGSAKEVAIVAQHITPNTKKPPNAYEVWLYNSPTDATSLGFVNPGVGQKGKLVAAGKWPSDALNYKYLIVTVETSSTPTQPGPIVLEGLTAGAAS